MSLLTTDELRAYYVTLEGRLRWFQGIQLRLEARSAPTAYIRGNAAIVKLLNDLTVRVLSDIRDAENPNRPVPNLGMPAPGATDLTPEQRRELERRENDRRSGRGRSNWHLRDDVPGKRSFERPPPGEPELGSDY